MSYTVADLDRLFSEEFEIEGKYGTFTPDDGDLWHLLKWEEVNNVPTPLGVVSLVDEYGGEGQGDAYWVVIKVTSEDGTERFFRRDGWYQSFSGGELDGPTVEVRPREKMVTVYEA